MPGSTLWIWLGMSIGILLSWDDVLLAVDPAMESATAIATQAERSLVATMTDAAKPDQCLSPADQQEWQTIIDQLRAAIATRDEAATWLMIQKLKLLADQQELQQLRSRKDIQTTAVSRTRPAWEIAIGPGYVRSGSPTLPPAPRPTATSPLRELKLLRHQLSVWTPQLSGSEMRTVGELAALAPAASAN